MTPALPFRTTPRQATPDELTAPRRSPSGRLIRRPFTPAEELLPEIEMLGIRWQRRPRESALLEWAAHPDERVVVTLVDSLVRRAGLRYGVHAYRIPAAVEGALLERGCAINAAEHIFWNPVMDRRERMLELPSDQSAPTKSAPGEADGWEAALSAASAWVQAQTDPRALRPLLTFQSPALRWRLFSDARCFDWVLFAAAQNGDDAAALAINASLAPEYRQQLAVWASTEESIGRVRSGEVLVRLATFGYPIPEPIVKRLLARTFELVNGAGHLDLLLKIPGALATTDLVALVRKGTVDEKTVAAVMAHPAAGPDVWHAIAERVRRLSGSPVGLDILLRSVGDHPATHRDPVVRQALLTHPDERARLRLLPTATPDEYREIVSTLPPDNVRLMHEAIVQGNEAQIAGLPEALWAPLVESGNRWYFPSVLRIPGAMARPAVRRDLMARGAPHIVAPLFLSPDSEDADVRRCFAERMGASENHSWGLELLESSTHPALRDRLQADDLLPLLSSPVAAIRQRALIVGASMGPALAPTALTETPATVPPSSLARPANLTP